MPMRHPSNPKLHPPNRMYESDREEMESWQLQG